MNHKAVIFINLILFLAMAAHAAQATGHPAEPNWQAPQVLQQRLQNGLQTALQRYIEIQDNGGWALQAAGPKLERGVQGERVRALRKRLAQSDDLALTAVDSDLFDEQLEQAVRNFQYRHMLKIDGIVGRQTRAALNRSASDKIDQILLNLKRLQELPALPQGRFVLVDLAGFQIHLYQAGQPIFTARAQIGSSWRPTPLIHSAIRWLEINPSWTVPETIFYQDMLPEIQKDPAFLEKKQLHVLTWQGEPVDQQTIDWYAYPAQEFPYMLRQYAGPDNPMGQIKFIFPNEDAIYLHDTPKRELFNEPVRPFSSGCVRVENPLQLAELVVDDPSWTQEKFQQQLDTGEAQKIFLHKKIPVIFVYLTVASDGDGQILFRQDIYQQDKKTLNQVSNRSSIQPQT